MRRRPQPRTNDRGAQLHALAAIPWPRAVGPLLAGLWGVLAVVFAVLAVSAYHASAFPLDRSVSGTVQSWRSDFFVPGVDFIGDLAGPTGAAVEYVLILTTLLVLRLVRETICLAVSGLGSEGVNVVSNGLVARPRPPTYHGHTFMNLGSHSFPSGHTADALGLVGFLLYLSILAGRAHPSWRRWLVAGQIIGGLYLVDVGVSRVLEGQHWPSDVAAGYVAGALMLTVGIVLYHLLALRSDRPASRTDWQQNTANQPA